MQPISDWNFSMPNNSYLKINDERGSFEKGKNILTLRKTINF